MTNAASRFLNEEEKVPSYASLIDANRLEPKLVFATDDWIADTSDLREPESHVRELAFTSLTNLAGERFESKILFSTDNWFADASNLLKASDPVFIEGKFTEYGKWMDGWESRRKRTPGHDWCIIKLGLPGVLKGIDVDTAFFTGNHAPRFSLQAACLPEDTLLDELPSQLDIQLGELGQCASNEDMERVEKFQTDQWTTIVPFHELGRGYPETRHNYFPVKSTERWTHVRLNMYPDGGIARLRLYGHVAIDWTQVDPSTKLDLAAASNGGQAIACSDQHFGEPRNLIGPGRGINMGDGWETARKSDRPAVLELDDMGMLKVPGSDWAILKLGHKGYIHELDVDTLHFKGNFPESCMVEGCYYAGPPAEIQSAASWVPILPRTKLSAHAHHHFRLEDDTLQQQDDPINYLRLTIYPDGGVSRLRAVGVIAP